MAGEDCPVSKEQSMTKSRKRMGLWIRQVASWVKMGLKHIFPYTILAVVSCAILFFPNVIEDCKETEVRWLGLGFQIIGILVVVRQLSGRLTLFRKPSFLSSIKNYFRRFPSRYTKNITLSAHSSLGALSGSARIRVGRRSNSSLESRVESLEGEVEELRRDIRVVGKSLDRHKEDNRNSLETMREENRRGQENLKKLVDDAVVGGIHLEWIGILYLLVGIVFATMAPEIATLSGYGGQCSQ